MYTGTLIDDLIAAVERTEQHREAREAREDKQLAYWHEATTYELKVAGQDLLGVA
jgi:hypothetical protein